MWGYNNHLCGYSSRVTSPCRNPPHSVCRVRSCHRSCSPEVRSCPKKPTFQRYCSAPVSTRNWNVYSELQPTVNKITLQQPPGKRNDSKKMAKNNNKAATKEKVNTPKKEVNTPKKEAVMDASKKGETEPTTKKTHVEDHEYIHFLLKITEDILRNNIYATEELEKLFKSHVDANRGRLDEDKMWAKIEQLKKELNLPLPEKELACACNDDIKKSPDCTCCTNRANNQNAQPNSCSCNNPKCPSHVATATKPSSQKDLRESPAERPKSDDGMKIPEQKEEKCDPAECDREPPIAPAKKPSVIFKDDTEETTVDISVESNKLLDDPQQSTDPKPAGSKAVTIPSTEKISSKGDCVDPVHCKFQNINEEIPKTKQSKISNVGFSPNSSTSASIMPSVVKIVTKDDPNDPNSQVILYSTKDMDERCICNVSHQKTVLKIEIESGKDEEYILVNGPICMPLSMLENKTVPVLVENVSSIILNSEEVAHDVPSVSRVNLFHGNDDFSRDFEDGNLDSVSALMRKIEQEPDFDLTPQRDTETETENEQKESGEFLLKSHSKTKGSGLSADDSVENKPSADSTISKENVEKPPVKETEIEEPKNNQNKEKKMSEGFVPSSPVTKCTPETCPKMTKQLKEDVGVQDLALMEPLHLDDSGDNKYHYLLKDVSTSTTSAALYEKSPLEVLLTPSPGYKSDSDRPEILPLEDYVQEEVIPQKESKEDYQKLMDDEYEMKPTKEPSFESAELPESLPSEQEYSSPKTLSEDENHMSEPEQAPALVEEIMPRRTWSPVLSETQGHKPEGLKVRYSINYEDPIIAQLDELPKLDKPIDNASMISEKMKEFRKIGGDENENEMKRFQITNPDNFEIRRVSTSDTSPDEQDEKVKSTCCGLGTPKSKKRLSA